MLNYTIYVMSCSCLSSSFDKAYDANQAYDKVLEHTSQRSVWHLLRLSLNKTKQNIGKYLHKFYRQSWQAVYALLFPSFSPYYSHFLPIFAFYFDLFFIHKTNVRNVPEITLKRLNWHAQRVGGKRGAVYATCLAN